MGGNAQIIGFPSNGTTNAPSCEATISGGRYVAPISGVITHVSGWIFCSTADHNFKFGVYDAELGEFLGGTAEMTATANSVDTVYTGKLTRDVPIIAGRTYDLVCWAEATTGSFTLNNTASQTGFTQISDAQSYETGAGGWPTPKGETPTADTRVSIYGHIAGGGVIL